ncbi:hypothetical protein Ahy_A03g013440 [Arachis hypogaea]|uniref:Uncharacterized protein n=1 Tax=Arachis hypogaea TaxID=3818 RepID=A0A445DVP4_ARAHY|nr:hypothetical protein Ahy_A03g013440 [Arachis hypogaea]
MASSSRAKKGKDKELVEEQATFDQRRFKSKHNEHTFFGWMISKDIVPEVLDSHGLPLKLRRGDLTPKAKEWHDIVRRSLIPTSNNSEAVVPLEEFEDTYLVSIGKPITKERLEYVTTTKLERHPLVRRKRRREAIQEEEQEEEEEQNALNMNQLQNALEGITQQYSQIQQS